MTDLGGHAQVVVIGGGIAGCSILYHLARLGWSDCILLEKGELTGGTTWHSVGNTPVFSGNPNLMRLLQRSIDLYESIEQETGQATGVQRSGSLRLATTPEMMEWYAAVAGTARQTDFQMEVVDKATALALNPLISGHGVLGALYAPDDGHVDPSGVTMALAKGAQALGAQVLRRTTVQDLSLRSNGGFLVGTNRGTIEADFVVNAAGIWARQVGQMLGIDLPLVTLEHQYVISERLGALERTQQSPIPVTRDPAGSFYMRPEGEGLLLGFYEDAPREWAAEGIPPSFGRELLAPQPDQIAEYFERATHRVPALSDVGIRNIINGPDAFSPDGRCLIGEVPGVPNFFVFAGFSSLGIAYGGGAGFYAAEWIVEGTPSLDLSDLDVRRFGAYAARQPYVRIKASESYEREYAVHFPHEELPAGRPLKTSAIHDRLAAKGAVFESRFGWDRPAWFPRDGQLGVDLPSFTRPNWFETVGAECRTVREAAGVLDQSSFAKFEISGPHAAGYLDHLTSNALPTSDGRLVLSLFLNQSGGIEVDVSITRLSATSYFLVTAAAAAARTAWLLQRNLPQSGGVDVKDLTAQIGCLTLSGPNSRKILQRLSSTRLDGAEFPFFSYRSLSIASVPVRALRISFIGELGWELYAPTEYTRHLYDEIFAAGEDLGIIDYGYRALDAMRLEKGYLMWGSDITSHTTPMEAGLNGLCRSDKGTFVGREALLATQAGTSHRLVQLDVVADFPAHGWESVLFGDSVVGYVTSGDYGHTVDRNLAMAYVECSALDSERTLRIEMLGKRYHATVLSGALHDPDNLRLRS